MLMIARVAVITKSTRRPSWRLRLLQRLLLPLGIAAIPTNTGKMRFLRAVGAGGLIVVYLPGPAAWFIFLRSGQPVFAVGFRSKAKALRRTRRFWEWLSPEARRALAKCDRAAMEDQCSEIGLGVALYLVLDKPPTSHK